MLRQIEGGLNQQVRQLLADMSTVSEAPATNMQGDGSARSKPETKAPKMPGGDERLLDIWVQRLVNCGNDSAKLRVWLIAGRVAMERRRGRPWSPNVSDDYGNTLVDMHGQPVRAGEEENVERILTWYEGWDVDTICAVESETGAPCKPLYVRRLRRKNDLHPDTGKPVPPSEFRRAKALELEAAGWSERRIGSELGVSRPTVRRLLDRPTPRDASEAA